MIWFVDLVGRKEKQWETLRSSLSNNLVKVERLKTRGRPIVEHLVSHNSIKIVALNPTWPNSRPLSLENCDYDTNIINIGVIV